MIIFTRWLLCDWPCAALRGGDPAFSLLLGPLMAFCLVSRKEKLCLVPFPIQHGTCILGVGPPGSPRIILLVSISTLHLALDNHSELSLSLPLLVIPPTCTPPTPSKHLNHCLDRNNGLQGRPYNLPRPSQDPHNLQHLHHHRLLRRRKHPPNPSPK